MHYFKTSFPSFNSTGKSVLIGYISKFILSKFLALRIVLNADFCHLSSWVTYNTTCRFGAYPLWIVKCLQKIAIIIIIVMMVVTMDNEKA